MTDYMKEAERLTDAYAVAYMDFVRCGKSDHEEARAALLAHIQRGAVPEGYDIAPTFRGYAKLGIGQYVLHNCPRTDEDYPSLVIAIATEEEKAGRQVGELRQSQPGLMIQPERIAVRIDFKSVAALDALEQQLRFLREDSFHEPLTAPAPAPTEVPMPEPVVQNYPSGKWSYHADQLRTYGDDREAAGYERGLAEAGREAVPLIQKGEVLVTVTGLTGSGKSAIAGEIEIMCRALGLDVEWVGGDAEKRLTHADWTDALEMYRPRVRIIEANISQADAALRGEVKP